MILKFNQDWHSYWLNGKRCLGATSVAGYPDNRTALEKWMKRMVLLGGAHDPKLMERVAAYATDKQKLNDLAEQALELAKANEARDTGSAVHRLTELIDTGVELVQTELSVRVQHAWTQALTDHDLEVVPEFVERIVVYPDLYVAGTFDRLVRHKTTGQLMILDLKTGSKAVEYPHAIAIQLAIYANAPLLAGPLRNGQTDQFDPMPDVNKTTGLVVHMPAEGQVEVVEINIAKGWQAFNEVCLPIIGWREEKNLARQTISAAAWAPTPRLVTADGAVETQAPPPASPVPSTISTARLHWIEARCRKIVDQGYGRRLMHHWPPNIPLFRDGGPRTDTDIDLIAAACAEAEKDTGLPFPPTDPNQPTTTKATTARSIQHEPVS